MGRKGETARGKSDRTNENIFLLKNANSYVWISFSTRTISVHLSDEKRKQIKIQKKLD